MINMINVCPFIGTLTHTDLQKVLILFYKIRLSRIVSVNQ